MLIGTLIFAAVASLISLVGSALLAFAVEALTVIGDYTLNISDTIDSYSINGDLTESLSTVLFTVGIAFLTVNFLWKGFQTYILYTDGDPEGDPIGMLTLYCKALTLICTFDTIFQLFVEGTNSLIDSLNTIIKDATNTNVTIDDMISTLFSLDENNVKTGLVSGILGIVFGVISIIVFFGCLKNGIELFIMRIGLPIASVGLINQDKGIFKNYFMSICKAFVSIIIKIVCCQLGYSIMLASTDLSTLLNGTVAGIMGIILGIVLLIVALTAPKLLGEFMVPSGGQSMMMKAYYTSAMVSRAKSIFTFTR